MTREEALKILQNNLDFERGVKGIYPTPIEEYIVALEVAIEALRDNKPSRTWIAKNEYRRGWHDAITKALSETLKIYVGNEIFDIVQKETLIGLGLSMDSALGAEPYSKTKEPYPEPDRPHGEWLTEPHSRIIHCSNCGAEENMNKIRVAKWCYSCGADMRREGDEK